MLALFGHVSPASPRRASGLAPALPCPIAIIASQAQRQRMDGLKHELIPTHPVLALVRGKQNSLPRTTGLRACRSGSGKWSHAHKSPSQPVSSDLALLLRWLISGSDRHAHAQWWV